MPSFINKKNKLSYIQKESQKNSQNLSRQKNKNDKIIYTYNVNKLIYHAFKNIRDISLDWTDLENNFTDLTPTELAQLITFENDRHYQNWEIVWERMDIRLLAFFYVDVLVRTGNGTVLLESNANPQISKNFLIEDISGETSAYYKRVTMQVSFYLKGSGIAETLQGKLNVLFVNPRQYN